MRDTAARPDASANRRQRFGSAFRRAPEALRQAMDAQQRPTRQQLHTLLAFYAEAGLDFAIEAEPDNRFEAAKSAVAEKPVQQVAPQQRMAQTPPPPPMQSAQPTGVIPDAGTVALAEATALAAQDLDQLAAAVAAFDGCNLKRSARATVFEGGRRGADMMLVFGAPSRDDDASAEAFAGPDGILLRRMLAAIGLAVPSDVYAGFCVPWMVPGGGQPTDLHLKICAPFLARQIALARPKMVVALGNTASRQLLATRRPIHVVRGQWSTLDAGGAQIPLVSLFEPSFLRDQPRFKRETWSDLRAISERLGRK